MLRDSGAGRCQTGREFIDFPPPVQPCSNNNKTEIRPLNYAVVTRAEHGDVKRECGKWKRRRAEKEREREREEEVRARMRGRVRRLSHNLLRPFRQPANAPEDTRYLTSSLHTIQILGISERVTKEPLISQSRTEFLTAHRYSILLCHIYIIYRWDN